jgi:ABC-2 type transport system ATP-binding protein
LAALLVGHAVPAYRLRLRPPVPPVADALRAQPWVSEVEQVSPEQLRVIVTSTQEAELRLAGVLSAAAVRVVSIVPEAPDLEQVFLELTS